MKKSKNNSDQWKKIQDEEESLSEKLNVIW